MIVVFLEEMHAFKATLFGRHVVRAIVHLVSRDVAVPDIASGRRIKTDKCLYLAQGSDVGAH